jgi:glycosyltransferase involved in cell wall biosynthesis
MGYHCPANLFNVSESFTVKSRITILNHETILGGGEFTLLRFLKHCNAERFDFHLILPKDGLLADEARKIAIKVQVLPFDDQLLNIRRKSRTFTVSRAIALRNNIKRLRQLILSQKPDAVFSNSMKAHVYGSFALRGTGIPYGWRLHDIIDEKNFGNLQRRFIYWLARRYPVSISAVSKAVAAPLQNIGISPDVLTVIYNGVEIGSNDSQKNEGAFRASLGLRDDDFVVLLPGRIMPEKGHTILVEAARSVTAAVPSVKFVFAGDAFYSEYDYKAELETLIKKYSLGQYFIFAGFQREMAGVYRDSDLIVQPAIIPESLPTVLLEAMAASRLVISSSTGGSIEIITDGEDGFIVPARDPQKLAEKIIDIAARYSTLQHIRDNASQKIRHTFSSEQYVKNMELWLERLSSLPVKK